MPCRRRSDVNPLASLVRGARARAVSPTTDDGRHLRAVLARPVRPDRVPAGDPVRRPALCGRSQSRGRQKVYSSALLSSWAATNDTISCTPSTLAVGSSVYMQPRGLLPWTVVGIEASGDLAGALQYYSDPLSRCVVVSASLTYSFTEQNFYCARLSVTMRAELAQTASAAIVPSAVPFRARPRRSIRSSTSAPPSIWPGRRCPRGRCRVRTSSSGTSSRLAALCNVSTYRRARSRHRRCRPTAQAWPRRPTIRRSCVHARAVLSDPQTPALAASSNLYFGSPLTYSIEDGYRYRDASFASFDAVMDAAMPTVDAAFSVRVSAQKSL